eukprot:g16988.t1
MIARLIECVCGNPNQPTGEQIDHLLRRVKQLEQQNDKIEEAVIPLVCVPCEDEEQARASDVYSKDEIHELLSQAQEDAELLVKEKRAESFAALKAELKTKDSEIEELKVAKAALHSEQATIKSMLEEGSISEEKMQSLSSSIFDNVNSIIKKSMDTPKQETSEKRAFRLQWEQIAETKALINDSTTPQHLRDAYRQRQSLLTKCPERGDQTFGDWQQDVYSWAIKLLEVGLTCDDLGERVTADGLKGFRHEQRRARACGKNLIKIMMRLEEEACPLVKNVVTECYKLIPLLKRWEDMTPLVWVGVLEDVFEKEEEVCGPREDQSKWEYSLQSLLLDKTTTQHLRMMYDNSSKGNFKQLRNRLNSINVTDAIRYTADGKVYTHKRGKNEKDPLEELYVALGEHATLEAEVTSSKQMNRAFSTILGRTMITSGVTTMLNGTPRGEPEGGNQIDGSSFFGGGAPGGGTDTTNKWLSPEELKKLNQTPCKFGENCWNLRNKGKCLRKHTNAELKAGRAYWREKNPEAAAKFDKEQEERKKKQQQNKDKPAAASASTDTK